MRPLGLGSALMASVFDSRTRRGRGAVGFPQVSFAKRPIAQFQRPDGGLGRLAGWIMATRGSNRERNFWGIELLAAAADHRLLEIGFGSGVATERLAEWVSDGEVVGIDHSSTMLEQATRGNRAAIEVGRVRLHLGSAEALPDDLGRFDRIVSANVVMFWEDPQAVCTRLRSLLAPGGMLATTEQPRHASEKDAVAMGLRIENWMRPVN